MFVFLLSFTFINCISMQFILHMPVYILLHFESHSFPFHLLHAISLPRSLLFVPSDPILFNVSVSFFLCQSVLFNTAMCIAVV